MTELRQARAAKQRLREQLRGRRDVVGVGLARTADGYCLKVNVTAPTDGLPGSVDGVDVVVAVVGEIRAQEPTRGLGD